MSYYDNLLKAYYSHLQHSEKQRSTFLQIYLAITGAGVIGLELVNVDVTIKLPVALLMIIVTWYGIKIMKKSRDVVKAYTSCIFDIIDMKYPFYSVHDALPRKNQQSKSREYVFIFWGFFLFYTILSLVYSINLLIRLYIFLN